MVSLELLPYTPVTLECNDEVTQTWVQKQLADLYGFQEPVELYMSLILVGNQVVGSVIPILSNSLHSSEGINK